MEKLDVPDAGNDAAVSRMGALLVGDPVATAHEMARVLKPGGRFSVAAWTEAEVNPNTSDLRNRVPASWDFGRWVDWGCAPVRGDGHGLGRAPVGLGRAPVFVAFDAEIGHLAFDDTGVEAPTAQGQQVAGYLPQALDEGGGQVVRGKRPPAR